MTSLQSFDKIDGFDLFDPQVRLLCEQAQHRFKPTLLIIGLPCTVWCIINENINYSQQMHEPDDLRDGERDGVKLSVEVSHDGNRQLLLLREPLKGRLWQEPEVDPDNYMVLCDAGAFGGKLLVANRSSGPTRF